MRTENSEIYIGQTISGEILSILDYSILHAGLDDPPVLHCPECIQDGDYQPLSFVPDQDDPRFVHSNVNRDCYSNKKKKRGHQLVQQITYKQTHNSSRYDNTRMEYEEIPGKRYDVRSYLPESNLAGIVAEVHHGSGRFRRRIYRTVRIAHRYDHGVYIILTPYAEGVRNWLEKRLDRGMSIDNPQAGGYQTVRSDCPVTFGTRIDPGSIDLSVLKV